MHPVALSAAHFPVLPCDVVRTIASLYSVRSASWGAHVAVSSHARCGAWVASAHAHTRHRVLTRHASTHPSLLLSHHHLLHLLLLRQHHVRHGSVVVRAVHGRLIVTVVRGKPVSALHAHA